MLSGAGCQWSGVGADIPASSLPADPGTPVERLRRTMASEPRSAPRAVRQLPGFGAGPGRLPGLARRSMGASIGS